MQSVEDAYYIFEQMVSMNTISSRSNLALIDYVAELLRDNIGVLEPEFAEESLDERLQVRVNHGLANWSVELTDLDHVIENQVGNNHHGLHLHFFRRVSEQVSQNFYLFF